jgi:hypothetical protein
MANRSEARTAFHPWSVSKTSFAVFIANATDVQFTVNPSDLHKQVARCWNRARETVPGWPQITLKFCPDRKVFGERQNVTTSLTSVTMTRCTECAGKLDGKASEKPAHLRGHPGRMRGLGGSLAIRRHAGSPPWVSPSGGFLFCLRATPLYGKGNQSAM